MRAASPIFRLSIGLILLTVSLLLIGDLIGLTPDQRRAEIAARKSIAESLAVQVSTDISDDRMEVVSATIRTLQKRNPGILSIALRTTDDRILVVAGDHAAHWRFPGVNTSTAAHVQVPIFSYAGRWGTLEVSFEPMADPIRSMFKGGSLAGIILFLAVSGFVAYWLFLKRALNELDPSAVVPDRVRAALDVLAEGLVIIDRGGVIILANAAFERMFGRLAKSLVGTRLDALEWESNVEQQDGEVTVYPWQPVLDGTGVASDSHLKLHTPLHQVLSFAVHVAPIKGQDNAVRGVVVTFDDVTELERKNVDLERALERLKHSQREISRQNRELQVLATRDPLTGALNRRSLFDGLATLINEAADAGEPVSCMMVDIDHFKSINDRFGHTAGDRIIKLIARLLVDSSRSDDLVGRYGGEEFCIVLPGTDEAQAVELAEKVRATIVEGNHGKLDTALRMTASFGVASDYGDLAPGALIDRADKALYKAKQTGRNRVGRWSEVAATRNAVEDDRPDQEKTIDVAVERADEAVKHIAQDRDVPSTVSDFNTWPTVDGPVDVPGGIGSSPSSSSHIVLVDRIKQAIERSKRFNTRLGVLSVDIETVQVVRNTLGHASAEKLMRLVAARLKQTIRSTDTVTIEGGHELDISVSRIGGGGFVVLLTEMRDSDCATWIVHRLRAALKEILQIDGDEVLLDTNIGVSLYPEDGEEPELLLTHSGAALHEAKSISDRNSCLFYSSEMNRRAAEQLRMEAQLHGALEREELFLEYQPEVDMNSGNIVAFEALMRWRHPEWGLVPPLQFIPVAEHTGLIHRIETWLLKTALAQLKSWHEAGYDEQVMSINFSAAQFRDKQLAEHIVAAVDEAGVPRSTLVVEITETILIQNIETAVEIVEALHEAGIQVALDDFGTGYSSLSYLKRFPIDLVKIDRSFLRDFPNHAHDTAIVTAIIAMSHSLGLTALAEGVETAQQLNGLKSLGCDEAQGYLLSRPVSGSRATALLKNPAHIGRLVRTAEGGRHASRQAEGAIAGILNELPKRGAAG